MGVAAKLDEQWRQRNVANKERWLGVRAVAINRGSFLFLHSLPR